MIEERPDMSTKLKFEVYKCLKNIQYFFLPGTCIVCNQGSMRRNDLCAYCESKLPVVARPCCQCALPLPPGDYQEARCGACITRVPPFKYTVSAYEYKAPLNRLIGDFKYYGKLCNGRVMAKQLEHKLKAFYQDKVLPEVIIPVPLHRHRLQQRGYNQAGEIGKYLSRKMHLRLNQKICTRIQNNPAQMGLSAVQRRSNLRQAFAISSPLEAPSLGTVAIIDDVITTMSTVSELSKLLIKHGVNEIHIWSIARACK